MAHGYSKIDSAASGQAMGKHHPGNPQAVRAWDPKTKDRNSETGDRKANTKTDIRPL